MAWLAPETHPVWKAELRDGRIDPAVAAEVGRRIALVHAATAGRVRHRRAASRPTTSSSRSGSSRTCSRPRERHPDCAERAARGSPRRPRATKLALVHGDVSPKNILVGPRGPVFLDAECAWYGDPAFDLAFCLNHLLLKCLWRPPWRAALPRGVSTRSRDAYLAGVTWEPRRRARGARGAAAAGAAPRAGRRQVAGRVRHRGRRSRPRRARARSRCSRAAATRLAEVARGLAAGDRTSCERHGRSPSVSGRRVWDSRGRPTVEAEVALAGGARGRAIAPAGASTRHAARRSTSATAARASAACDVRRRGGERERRDRPALAGHGCDATRPRSTPR